MQVVKLLLMVAGGALMVSVAVVMWTFVIRSWLRERKGQELTTPPDINYCIIGMSSGMALMGVAQLIH